MSVARLVTKASRKTSAAVIGVLLTANTQLDVAAAAADVATEGEGRGWQSGRIAANGAGAAGRCTML